MRFAHGGPLLRAGAVIANVAAVVYEATHDGLRIKQYRWIAQLQRSRGQSPSDDVVHAKQPSAAPAPHGSARKAEK